MNKFETKVLDKFFLNRNLLIDKLENGDLTKRDFLTQNYMLISKLSMKPFNILDCPEKCIYNYQYYNVLAKYTKIYGIKSSSSKKDIKDVKLKIANYYFEKDKIIIQLLKNFDDLDIEAYYVDINSTTLNSCLIEIVIKNYYRYVLHTINDNVKKILIELGVFNQKSQKSIIDSYINSGY